MSESSLKIYPMRRNIWNNSFGCPLANKNKCVCFANVEFVKRNSRCSLSFEHFSNFHRFVPFLQNTEAGKKIYLITFLWRLKQISLEMGGRIKVCRRESISKLQILKNINLSNFLKHRQFKSTSNIPLLEINKHKMIINSISTKSVRKYQTNNS